MSAFTIQTKVIFNIKWSSLFHIFCQKSSYFDKIGLDDRTLWVVAKHNEQIVFKYKNIIVVVGYPGETSLVVRVAICRKNVFLIKTRHTFMCDLIDEKKFCCCERNV